MTKYVLKRIGLAFMTTFIILSLTFILIKCLPVEIPPGSKREQYAYLEQETALGYITRHQIHDENKFAKLKDEKTEEYEEFKKENGKIIHFLDHLDQKLVYTRTKILKQYGKWLRNIFKDWDWGQSEFINPNWQVGVIIRERLPSTIKINVLSIVFSVPFGIALGIWAALKKNTTTDHIISTSIMIFISIPSFVLITFLMLFFCYKNQWLPSQWPAEGADALERVKGYILPVFCLSFGPICGYCRFTRAELCEVMSSEYLLLARTKGLTKKQAIMRHALRNAMVPIVPSILGEVIAVLGGSMILERLYGIKGIGDLFVEALKYKDYNVLFVDMAIFTTISLLAGVVLDLSYGFIDPRIRMGAKK